MTIHVAVLCRSSHGVQLPCGDGKLHPSSARVSVKAVEPRKSTGWNSVGAMLSSAAYVHIVMHMQGDSFSCHKPWSRTLMFADYNQFVYIICAPCLQQQQYESIAHCSTFTSVYHLHLPHVVAQATPLSRATNSPKHHNAMVQIRDL